MTHKMLSYWRMGRDSQTYCFVYTPLVLPFDLTHSLTSGWNAPTTICSFPMEVLEENTSATHIIPARECRDRKPASLTNLAIQQKSLHIVYFYLPMIMIV